MRVILAAGALMGVRAVRAQDWPQISLEPVLDGFSFPVHITHAGDGSGRLFVVELAGRIRVVKDGKLLETPFLDISDRTGCRQGLLSVAFPPAYATKGRFYLNYTHKDTCKVIISRFSVSSNPDVADPTEQEVLKVDHEYTGEAIFHSGGELAFGLEGYLYLGIGDNDTGANPGDAKKLAQNLNSLRGKILRLEVETGDPATYTIPASNPFAGRTDVRPEIWALGVRNPWRSSFDRVTGDFYIADVGQSGYEEINFQPAGSQTALNYGWPIMEGPDCHDPLHGCKQAGLTLPVGGYANARTIDNCSITGGRVYRGNAYPQLQGIYFYGDYCSGKIWGLRRENGKWQSALLLDPATAMPKLSPEGIISFGEDEAGNIYVTDTPKGQIYKIIESTSNTPPAASNQSIAAVEDTALALTLWATDAEANALSYSIVTAPAHGTLTGTGAHRTYTPATNYHGSDSFVFKANDGVADSNHATVSITVSSVNDSPVANDDTAATRRNKAVTIQVLANDTDVDGGQLKVANVSPPENGTAIVTRNGAAVQYTPPNNFADTTRFTYVVTDGRGGTDSAVVTVSVK